MKEVIPARFLEDAYMYQVKDSNLSITILHIKKENITHLLWPQTMMVSSSIISTLVNKNRQAFDLRRINCQNAKRHQRKTPFTLKSMFCIYLSAKLAHVNPFVLPKGNNIISTLMDTEAVL